MFIRDFKGGISVSKKQNQPRAPYASNRRKKNTWTTIVIYLMIIAMLLSSLMMGVSMFV
nr:stressosome-associated protein Prli42 [Alkalibacillus almallahensis]